MRILALVILLAGCASYPADDRTWAALEAYPDLAEIHQFDDVVQGYTGGDKVTLHVQADRVVELDRRPIRTGLDMGEAGQALDAATTVIGIAEFGATEINPLGWGVLPAKLLVNESAEDMPAPACRSIKRSLAAFGGGFGVMNIATIAGLGTAAFLPGALIGTAIYHYYTGDSPDCHWLGQRVTF